MSQAQRRSGGEGQHAQRRALGKDSTRTWKRRNQCIQVNCLGSSFACARKRAYRNEIELDENQRYDIARQPAEQQVVVQGGRRRKLRQRQRRR